MADERTPASREPRIHTRQENSHFVAWVGEADGKTDVPWTVVGETEADARERARARLTRPRPAGDAGVAPVGEG